VKEQASREWRNWYQNEIDEEITRVDPGIIAIDEGSRLDESIRCHRG